MSDEERHRKATQYALRECGDGFVQFSRNGRWGDCSGCPRDTTGRAYPEFCQFTDRYDHMLTADGLARLFDHHRRTYGQ